MEKKMRIFRILFLAVSASIIGIGIIAPFIPLYAESLGATGIWLGIIFSGFSISRGIFTPIIGKISDRIGRKIFISIGLFTYTILSIGYILAKNEYSLTLIRFLHGFAAAMVVPIAMAYIGEISPRGMEGKYLGTFNISFFLGLGAGPLIGGFLMEWYGMSFAFYAMGGFAAFSLLLILFLLPEKQKNAPNNKEENSVSFRKILQNNTMLGVLSFRAVNAIGMSAIFAFLPIFANSIGLTVSQIGLILSLSILLIALLQRPFGKFADKYSKIYLIIIGSIIGSVPLLLIPITHNFVQLLISILVIGFGSAVSMPSATALITELGRDSGMGKAMGLFNSAMSIGWATGPLMSGILLDLFGLRSIFYFGGIIGIIGTGVFYLFIYTKRNKPLNKVSFT
ncbi:MAG: MFS transporter [Methanosarcinales archaeon]